MGGYIRAAISGLISDLICMIVRPDIPITEDSKRIVGLFLCLSGGVAVYIWISTGVTVGITRIVLYFILFLIAGGAFCLAFLIARLAWKINYMRRMQDKDDAD